MVGIDISILLLVAIAVGGGIISTVVIGLLALILTHLKKESTIEEEQGMFPYLNNPGSIRLNLSDMQRAAAMAAAHGATEQEDEKDKKDKPEVSGGTYL